MPLKRLVILALLVAATPCWAGERDKRDTGSRDGTRSVSDRRTDRRTDTRRRRDVQNEDRPILRVNPFDEIRPLSGIPRAAMKKVPNFELNPNQGAGGSIIVKFMDQVRARYEMGKVTSYSGTDLTALDELIRDNNLVVEPLFKLSPQRLAAIEDKAVRYSNTAQPDLAGMMKISGPRGRILQAARLLNDMAIVEYVEFEQTAVPAMQSEIVACCLQSGVGTQVGCVEVSVADCIAMNGNPNENFIGAFACSDMDGDGFIDACMGACCFEDNQGVPACQSSVSPLDCAENPDFVESTFSGRGTVCQQNGGTIDCDFSGACCIELGGGGDDLCVRLLKVDCLGRGEDARFTVSGLACPDPNDQTAEDVCAPPGCGDEWAGNCFVPTPPPLGGIDPSGNSPFCDLDTCCQIICQLVPECCNNDLDNPGNWTEECARFANIYRNDSRDDVGVCFGPDPPLAGPCNISGTSCFAPSTTAGCSISSCCNSVCSVDPSCCDDSLSWDDGCVALANALCSTTNTGPTPDFFVMGVQGYLTAAPYGVLPEALVGGMFLPACSGSLRSTPELSVFSVLPPYGLISGFTGEGFDINGLESVGLALANLGKGDIGMSRGKNIKIGVLDHSAHIQPHLGIHEDLVGRVTVMPTNRTMTLLPNPIVDPNHGTAILGILAANPDNDLGIVSMAPESEVFFFPASTLEDGGRLLSAMVDVMEAFEPGDVLCIPLGLGEFGFAGCGLLLSNQTNWLMANMLTNAGITVIVPADNNACDLIANPQLGNALTNDAGAIVVGACSPGEPYTRIAASNHCTQCTNEAGDIVHVSAWGAAVATLGYGNMWDGGNVFDKSNNYTNSFGYTSAASAQIAALVARYQGIAKQMYGMPLTPGQIRTRPDNTFEVRGLFHGDFLWNQDLRATALGTPNGVECLGDFSFQDDSNVVAGFPDALLGAAWAVIGAHFGEASRLLRNVTVVRGRHISGTHFALGARDNSYLIVESEFTTRDQGARPVSPPDPTLRDITYLGAGEITDIVVDMEAELSIIEQLDVLTTVSTSSSGQSGVNLLIVELYDWSNRRWDFAGFAFTTPLDTDRTFQVGFGVQRFVRALDDKVKVRLYTLTLGSTRILSRTEPTHYIARYDFVQIDVGVVPGTGAITYPWDP